MFACLPTASTLCGVKKLGQVAIQVLTSTCTAARLGRASLRHVTSRLYLLHSTIGVICGRWLLLTQGQRGGGGGGGGGGEGAGQREGGSGELIAGAAAARGDGAAVAAQEGDVIVESGERAEPACRGGFGGGSGCVCEGWGINLFIFAPSSGIILTGLSTKLSSDMTIACCW